MLTIKRLFCASALLLILCSLPFSLLAQNNVLTGKVTDITDKPLENVSVVIKGTTEGTATSADGTYRIQAPKPLGNILVFSSVEFADKEVTQSAGNVINVQLEKSDQALETVIVVGYGTQKRKDITGSIVSVDKQRLEDLPNTNFVQALEGSLAGVSVSASGGGAEGNNVSILIRGRNSITASNTPLIILDGIPYNGSISDINPNDIASVDILKDASAAGIYGSRGSNGVILVTTKRGSNGKPVISYDGFVATERISNLPPVLTPEEFYLFKITREGTGSITTSEQEVYDSKNFPNWLDLATRNGIKNQHSIGIRGGNSAAKYYLSATYLNVKGVALNDNFKRLSTRFNLEVKVTDWLTYGTNTQLSYNDRAGLPASFGGENGAYFFNPLTTAYDSLGKLTIYPWPQDTHFGNPLAPTLAQSTDNTYKIFSGNYLQVKVPFIPGLGYRLNTGVEYQAREISTYYGRNTLDGFSNNGDLHTNNGNTRNYTIENILTYDRSFGKHSINFTGLYSFEKDIAAVNTLSAQQFPSDVLTAYQANVALTVTPGASYSKRTLISQMARINYNYDSRYLLTLTGRRDGSSVFGENNKYAFFPIAAIGWNIVNESFMANNKLFSNLKLRLSYGSNGNEAIDPYTTLARLTTRSYIDGSTTEPGYIPATLDNPNLRWETTKSANIALDFGLIDGRIEGSLEYYNAHTEDLLLNRQLSPVQGISSIIQNIGKTRNKGFEISLNTINIQGKDFSWTSNGNLSINRNKIEALYGDGKDDTLNQWFIGHPINVDFGYVYDGVWQAKEDTASTAQGPVHPGYAKIKDINNDGVINNLDRTILGRLEPRFIWGLSNTFTYKGFSLYVFMHGVDGRSQVNSLFSEGGVQSGVRHNTIVKNWWTPENPNNDYYANSLNANKTPNAVYLVQSSSFVRITDISLGYNFNKNILEKLKLSRLKLYVEARNPFTITNWTGLDPELGSQTSIPLQKEYVFGLNVSF